MRNLVRLSLAAVFAAAALAWAADPPAGKPADDAAKDKAKDYSNAPLVVHMMAFDKKNDGKITRDEVTDERLLRLFDQADTNKDGVVTKEELMALAAKQDAEGGSRGPRGDRSPRGQGGPGGPGDRGPGGPRQPGQVLPTFVQDELKLTDDQKKQLGELQKDVDAKLDKILTDDQKKQLKEARPGRGPGGPGERGPGGDDRGPGAGGPPPGDRGPGGPGGPGGPPHPGQVLPTFVQDELKLTDDQKKQLGELQKDVDAKLDKILTDDQKKQLKELRPGRGPGGPGERGPGGDDRGPGAGGPPPGDRGPGGPGGQGGPPHPGQVLPTFVQNELQLTDDQKKQLGELQKDVDAKLDKILTDDQKKQLKEARPGRGPGGPPPGDRGPERGQPNPDR